MNSMSICWLSFPPSFQHCIMLVNITYGNSSMNCSPCMNIENCIYQSVVGIETLLSTQCQSTFLWALCCEILFSSADTETSWVCMACNVIFLWVHLCSSMAILEILAQLKTQSIFAHLWNSMAILEILAQLKTLHSIAWCCSLTFNVFCLYTSSLPFPTAHPVTRGCLFYTADVCYFSYFMIWFSHVFFSHGFEKVCIVYLLPWSSSYTSI